MAGTRRIQLLFTITTETQCKNFDYPFDKFKQYNIDEINLPFKDDIHKHIQFESNGFNK